MVIIVLLSIIVYILISHYHSYVIEGTTLDFNGDVEYGVEFLEYVYLVYGIEMDTVFVDMIENQYADIDHYQNSRDKLSERDNRLKTFIQILSYHSIFDKKFKGDAFLGY